MDAKVNLVFDIDGVLIEAERIRIEKYRKLFADALPLVDSPKYEGPAWLFGKMKQMYDDGIDIDPSLYTLINPNTPGILQELSKRYTLMAYSVADGVITRKKLRATGILDYFVDIKTGASKVELLKRFTGECIFVDDRPLEPTEGLRMVHFKQGIHADKYHADKTITALEELL